MVRSMLAKAGGGNSKPSTGSLDPNVQRLQDELSEKLGAPVQIQHSGSGKGKVVVTYHSLDELDGILAHIK
jgi:ParB family chromosome partitioning protein